VIGLTADKLLLIAVLVAILFGPERLPHLAERLGSTVRAFRHHLTSTEQRMRDELGVDIDVDDWKKLDPRRYDPRAIIGRALAPDAVSATTTVAGDHAAEAVVDDRSPRTQRVPTNSAAAPEHDTPTAEPAIRPVFRRRSDGHLELVSSSPAAEEAETEIAVPVAS